MSDATKGADVYKTYQCAMCYKVNGSGGKKVPTCPTMPPAKVTPAELRDVIDYLGTLKGGK